jgi:hypothetical protein
MAENEIENNKPQNADEAKIVVNEYGSTVDSAVVVEESDRTVLLTDNETIVFPKEPRIDVVPKNRPRKVYMGMWGQTEIATVGLAGLAILSTLLLYLLVVAPSNRELEQNRAERDRLERELIAARGKYGDITSTETQVSKLLASVDDFELRYLPAAANGRTSVYQRINGLISAYGLVNTSGPDYAPLDVVDQTQSSQGEEETGRGKFRSLFPGVYVTMTVEGSYQNLRRFLREIEAGREFVVVSSVEIEPSDSQKKVDPSAPPAAQASAVGPGSDSAFGIPGTGNPNAQAGPVRVQQAGPRGKTHGETVSLRLEMAAYFRRPSTEMPIVPTE